MEGSRPTPLWIIFFVCVFGSIIFLTLKTRWTRQSLLREERDNQAAILEKNKQSIVNLLPVGVTKATTIFAIPGIMELQSL